MRLVRILKGRSARQPCLRGKSAMTAFTQEGYYLFANRQLTPELAKPAREFRAPTWLKPPW